MPQRESRHGEKLHSRQQRLNGSRQPQSRTLLRELLPELVSGATTEAVKRGSCQTRSRTLLRELLPELVPGATPGAQMWCDACTPSQRNRVQPPKQSGHLNDPKTKQSQSPGRSRRTKGKTAAAVIETTLRHLQCGWGPRPWAATLGSPQGPGLSQMPRYVRRRSSPTLLCTPDRHNVRPRTTLAARLPLECSNPTQARLAKATPGTQL